MRIFSTGATWQANGHTLHLGPYSLDRVDSDGTVHAGCHAIAREEIERFARVIL